MVSTTVNVVRYTALFSGALYGWYHRRSLQATHEKHMLEAATQNREKLVAEAKEAWKRIHESSNNTSLVTDPDDPRFDLEKLVAKYEKSS